MPTVTRPFASSPLGMIIKGFLVAAGMAQLEASVVKGMSKK